MDEKVFQRFEKPPQQDRGGQHRGKGVRYTVEITNVNEQLRIEVVRVEPPEEVLRCSDIVIED